jgi:hypothetical protein
VCVVSYGGVIVCVKLCIFINIIENTFLFVVCTFCGSLGILIGMRYLACSCCLWAFVVQVFSCCIIGFDAYVYLYMFNSFVMGQLLLTVEDGSCRIIILCFIGFNLCFTVH